MITVVSGMPESGTRLLMQILQSGGMELLTDTATNLFKNGEDSGYDYEPVRQLPLESAWLVRARGRVIKIEASLLKYLNTRFHYKVLYLEMEREVLYREQAETLAQMGSRTPAESAQILTNSLLLKSARVKNWLAKQSNIDQLFLNYQQLLREPEMQLRRMQAFLEQQLNQAEMLDVAYRFAKPPVEADGGNLAGLPI